MKKRLDTFTNAFLLMTFNEQPRRIRRASKNIDLSLDQTFIAPATKRGYSNAKSGELPQRRRGSRATAER